MVAAARAGLEVLLVILMVGPADRIPSAVLPSPIRVAAAEAALLTRQLAVHPLVMEIIQPVVIRLLQTEAAEAVAQGAVRPVNTAAAQAAPGLCIFGTHPHAPP